MRYLCSDLGSFSAPAVYGEYIDDGRLQLFIGQEAAFGCPPLFPPLIPLRIWTLDKTVKLTEKSLPFVAHSMARPGGGSGHETAG